MKQEKILLASAAVDLAESEDKSYLDITNRLCYFGEPNLNNMVLPIEGAEERAKTLVNMPVVAKYRPRVVGGKKLDDLGGHEMYVDPKTHKVKFSTEIIGTHISAEIKDDEVSVNGVTKTLPCLFAKSRVWARNEKIYAAIKRLYSEGKLFSSWEIKTKKYEFSEGVKTILDYVFLGNCFLGTRNPPSYPCAQAISIASLNEASDELAEALTLDMYMEEDMDKTDEKMLAEAEQEPVAAEESTTENNPEQETASLTQRDLFAALRKELCAKLDKWGYITYWLPEEKVIWCKTEDCKSELDFVVFRYAINDDKVTLEDPIYKTLPISIAQVEETINENRQTLEKKNEALVSANEKIAELSQQIEDLRPFKEAAEKAALEKAEAEKAEKRNALRAYAVKSTHITAEECESNEEIKKMIAELDEAGIKNLIVDRFMASLQAEPTAQINVSSVKEKPSVVKANLNGLDDEQAGHINPVKIFIS